MKTKTQILVDALRILARDIESADGVANAAIFEASERLSELEREKAELMAQVETVKSAYRNLCGAIGDMDDTEHDSVEQAEAIGVVFEKMREGWQIVNTAAHECINQIKAEVVMDFVEHIKSLFESGEYSEIARAYFRKANSGARCQVISLADDPEWCGIIAAKQHYLAYIANGE